VSEMRLEGAGVLDAWVWSSSLSNVFAYMDDRYLDNTSKANGSATGGFHGDGPDPWTNNTVNTAFGDRPAYLNSSVPLSTSARFITDTNTTSDNIRLPENSAPSTMLQRITVLRSRRAKTLPFETFGEAGTDAGALSDMGRKSILPNRRVERIYDLASTFGGRQLACFQARILISICLMLFRCLLRKSSLSFAACLFLFTVRSTSALEFILLSVTENKLFSVSTPPGNPALIGTVNVGTDLYELVAASPTRLYTFDRAGNTLITVDRFNAQVLGTVQLDQDVFSTRRGFDLSPAGVLYGLLPGMQLRTIDPLTGNTTFIANVTGAARVEAMAFAPDGTLYAAGSADDNATSESLYRLSTTTGELTYIGLMAVPDLDALTFGADGFLYGTDSEAGLTTHLFRIDPTTAAVDDLGDTGVIGANGIVAISQPTVRIVQSGDAVVISWSTDAAGFALESASGLDLSALWAPVLSQPEVVDGRKFVTNAITAEPRFYRLAR